MASSSWQEGGLSASLPQSSVAEPRSLRWTPHRIGPRFSWLDHNHILIIDGRLSEKRFEITTDVRRDTATVQLRENNHFSGQVQIERHPPGRGVVLTNAIVGQRLRRGGLAAIMTWCAFRELLSIQESATFRIRMPQPPKASAAGTGVRSVGMAVIAARLGFRPELPLDEILCEDNITDIEAVPGDKDNPPALRMSLKGFPSTLVAHVLSPDAIRQTVCDHDICLKLKQDVSLIRIWLDRGLLLVNGGYRLGSSGIERFLNALATDEEEFIQFGSKVRAL